MTDTPFKLTIHIVSSLDGYIAKKDNSISWFETTDTYEKGITATEEQATEFLKKIDCYVMGSRTYKHALELSKSYGWVYGDVPTVVISNRNLPIERNNIEVYCGDLAKLVNDSFKLKYKNVWLVGGAALIKEFIRLKLADEIRLSILPILLGDGLPLFEQVGIEQALHLKGVSAFKNGMVELVYEIKKG